MISKTCKEASKNIPARGGAPKEEYMFVNAEEEFFYEVRPDTVQISVLFNQGMHSLISTFNILSFFYFQQAIIKFHYSVQEEADTCLSGRWSFDDVPMKPYRTVMLIPADRMPAIMDKLKEYLTV